VEILYWLLLIVLIVVSFRLIKKLTGLWFKFAGAAIVAAIVLLGLYVIW
jgi:hypothetical protein